LEVKRLSEKTNDPRRLTNLPEKDWDTERRGIGFRCVPTKWEKKTKRFVNSSEISKGLIKRGKSREQPKETSKGVVWVEKKNKNEKKKEQGAEKKGADNNDHPKFGRNCR